MTDYLFDLGNTRLKWATIDSPLSIQALAHDDMRIALPPEVRGETAWVASVAPTPALSREQADRLSTATASAAALARA